MRLPRLITRRRVKWVGLVLCVLVLGVYVASAWYEARWWFYSKPNQHVNIGISRGRLVFGGHDHWPLRHSGERYAYLPLWIPLLLVTLPTACLWYTDWRRPKPWQCATCRYDLRGLDRGVCPECGESTK